MRPKQPLRAPARPRHEFDERQPRTNQSTILIEGGEDFDDDDEEGEEIDEENEPNFNRADGTPVPVGQVAGGAPRPAGAGAAERRTTTVVVVAVAADAVQAAVPAAGAVKVDQH